jgi:hypothetical protein
MRATQVLVVVVCFLTLQARSTPCDSRNVTVYLDEIVSNGNNISATLNDFVPQLEQSFVVIASAALNLTALAFNEVPSAVQSVQEAAGAIENISILAQNNMAQAQSTAKEAADAMQEIAYFMSLVRKNIILIAISSFGILTGGVTAGILTARHLLVLNKQKNVVYRAIMSLNGHQEQYEPPLT